jgi:hypothetical protein
VTRERNCVAISRAALEMFSPAGDRELPLLLVDRLSLPELEAVMFATERELQVLAPPWLTESHCLWKLRNALGFSEAAALAEKSPGLTDLLADLTVRIMEIPDGEMAPRGIGAEIATALHRVMAPEHSETLADALRRARDWAIQVELAGARARDGIPS